MPRKKRSHAHHKKSQGQRTAPSTTLGEQQVDDRPYNTQAAAASKAQPAFDCCQCFKKAPKGYQELPSESFPPELFHPSSQPRQYSPTSVAQVAVNPAQFESASAASTMATKPGAVSVTMGGATASGATAGGSPTTAGTTQRGTAKVAMPETALVSPAGATIIDIPTPGTKGSPKDTPKPAPMHPAKATPPTTGGGIIVVEAVPPWKAEVPTLQESLKQTAKSVPTTSSKVDMAKKDPAKLVTAVAAPAAAAGAASLKGPQTKVQVEVVPPGAKAAKEELAVDPFDALADSLPSSESFAPAAHVYTGPEVIEHGLTSKKGVICGGDDCPLPPGYRSEDMAPVADVKPKDVPKPMSTDEALDSLSFGFTTSMAPIPQKQEKKVEDLGAIDALSAGFSNFAPPPPAPIKKAEEFKSAPVTKSPAPPIDKKAKVEKFADDFSLMSGLDSPLDTKPKTAESVPTTSSKVDMAKKDHAKLVTAVAAPAAAAGDASLKGPQTKKVEDLAAIDASSAGFSNFAPPPPAPIKKAEEFKSAPVTKSPAPPIDKKAKVEKLADDFSLMSGLDSPLDTKPKTAESVPTTSSKVDMAKKDPAKLVTAVAAPAAAAGDASLKGPQTKVQVEVVPPGAKAAKELAPMHPAKATPPTTGGGIIVVEAVPPWKAEVPTLQESLKQTAKSVPTTSSKVDMAKKDPAKLVTAVAAPAAAAGDASLKGPQTKVQVEVVPPGAKAAKELAPMHPAKATPPTTGGGIIVVEAVPPWKAEVPTLQESLKQTAKSVPTTSSKVDMAKKDPAKLVTAVAAPAAAAGDASLKGPQTKKVEDLAAIEASSAGFSNFAPPPPAPIKKAEEFKSAPVTKSPAPPIDKKAKVEKFADDFSLMSGLDSPLDTKPKTAEGGSMSLDALSALGDSLPAPEPAPQPPKIRHEDIVMEGKLTSKKGVFVGERDDTLPPKYRFTENKVKDLPPLKPEAMAEAKVQAVVRPKQPSMDDSEALDLLSRDLSSSAGPAAASVAVTTEQRQPRLEPMSAPVLDDLAGTLLPDAPVFKSKGDKPKSKSRSKSKKQREEDPSSIDHLSGQLSSDVVSASTNKGGKS
ncbi:calpastatin isoform X32 [Salmo salar]|uniref:Calpastatin n=1 Tax=Salmo salar TaxID=8030 RepID=A0ABM3DQA6_SALSA|nr:calpastatin isoform X32 [Salmo salar]